MRCFVNGDERTSRAFNRSLSTFPEETSAARLVSSWRFDVPTTDSRNPLVTSFLRGYTVSTVHTQDLRVHLKRSTHQEKGASIDATFEPCIP